MAELEKASKKAVGLVSDLRRFEAVILEQLDAVGLPGDSVFVEIAERQKMLSNVAGALGALSVDQRERSHYISKMIAAAAVGLSMQPLTTCGTRLWRNFAPGSQGLI